MRIELNGKHISAFDGNNRRGVFFHKRGGGGFDVWGNPIENFLPPDPMLLGFQSATGYTDLMAFGEKAFDRMDTVVFLAEHKEKTFNVGDRFSIRNRDNPNALLADYEVDFVGLPLSVTYEMKVKKRIVPSVVTDKIIPPIFTEGQLLKNIESGMLVKNEETGQLLIGAKL